MNKSVYFTSLEIENVRCFGDRQELDLTVRATEPTSRTRRPARWTLILGDNGVGKTTLLQCLSWMRLLPGRFDPELFEEDNEYLERLLPMNPRGNLNLSSNVLIGSTLVSVGDTVNPSESRGRSVKMALSLEFNSERVLVDKTKNRRGAFEESLVVAYGADRRLGLQNLDNPDLLYPSNSRRLSESTELYDLQEMLGNVHYASVSNRDSLLAERDLKRLKEVITKILPEEQDPDAIQIHAPDSLRRGRRSGAYLDTFTGPVSLSELSLGYRTTLAWTSDFAWRLLREHPQSPNPFAEPAVVLIDEIDLHLHPRWQLGIMENLSMIFPSTQFVATSHSPLMAQVADDANFVLLRKRQEEGDVEIINEPEVVRGWRVDQILTSGLFGVLGARSPQIELLFTQRDELLAKPSLNADEEAELGHLRAQIANLPTAQYPGDRDAMNYIREAAALLRKHRIGEE